MITMSKQIDKIVDYIISKKSFDIDIEAVIKKYKSNDILDTVNKVVKELSSRGYIIESINPLKIKEV